MYIYYPPSPTGRNRRTGRCPLRCLQRVLLAFPRAPSHRAVALPRGFQRFGFEKLFRAGGFSDLG